MADNIEIVIRSEDDAIEWLEKAIKKEIDSKAILNLRFEGWPVLNLHYAGRDFDQSVPTRVMPALLDVQTAVHRLYCHLKYSEPNLRKLKADDKDRTELVIKVDKGSSKYSTNLDGVLTEVFKSAISTMDSIHILIAVLGVAALYGTGYTLKAYINKLSKDKKLETKIKMTELEIKRLQVVTSAVKQEPILASSQEEFNAVSNELLKVLKNNDTLKLDKYNEDIEIGGEYADQITEKERVQAEERRIDGEFLILAVISGETDGFRLKVKRREGDKKFNVDIPAGTLNTEQIEVLKNNEWAKKPVSMEINARVLRGEITSARLVSASRIERE